MGRLSDGVRGYIVMFVQKWIILAQTGHMGHKCLHTEIYNLVPQSIVPECA
jgi:hypothetical protein